MALEAPPADPTPADAGLEPQPLAPPLTLGAGKLLLAGSTVNIDFTDIFDYDDPVLLSFAPSVWYGINDQLTIGITHDFGTTPWTPRPPFLTYFTTSEQPGEVDSVLGGGLCVSDGCPKPARSAYYNSTGADALFSLTRGRLSLAAHPGLDGTVRSPFVLDLRIGLLARLIVTDRISMVIDPRLRYGLVGRGSYHDAIDLPIWVWCDIAGPLSIYVHTGYRARLDYLKDNYSITLQYGANVKLGQRLAIGLDLGFDRVNESFAERALGLRIMYAP